MLFSNNSSLRGKHWKLPSGYWRACNATGQQCSFRIRVEAQRFAERVLPSSHPKLARAVLNKKRVI